MKLPMLFRRRKMATGPIKTQTDNLPAPELSCICPGEPPMELLASNMTGLIYECHACCRLLYRSKRHLIQKWYLPEAGGTFAPGLKAE